VLLNCTSTVPDWLKCVVALAIVHVIAFIVTPGAICRFKPMLPARSAPGGLIGVAPEHPTVEAVATARLNRIA
jgi:hypothetical protein